jgi:hypothetical protein
MDAEHPAGAGPASRLLLLGLLVPGPLVLGVAVGILAWGGRNQLRLSHRAHLADEAARTAGIIDAHLARTIRDVWVLTRVPDIQKAASDTRGRPEGAEVQDIDREWIREKACPERVRNVLESSAAEFLRQIIPDPNQKSRALTDTIYREFALADRQGRLAAASGVTSDYDQADEAWFKETVKRSSSVESCRANPSTCAYLEDVEWDKSASVDAFGISLPVFDNRSGDLIGVLKAVADPRELAAFLKPIGLPDGVDFFLFRANGDPVLKDEKEDRNAFFEAARKEHVLDELAQGRLQTRHFAFVRRVGAASSGATRSVPQLNWAVGATQDEAQVFRPLNAALWYLVTGVGLASVAACALGVSLAARRHLSATPPPMPGSPAPISGS